MKLKILVGCFAVLSSISLFANSYESLDEIENKIYDYLHTAIQKESDETETSIRVTQIDSRLKLAKCGLGKLSIFSPYKRSVAQSSTVAVKCKGPIAWSFFVSVDIKMLKKVVVTQRYISSNHLFVLSDLKVTKVDVNKLRHGFFLLPKDIVGKLSKRSMSKGKTVKPMNLKLAKIIEKGDLINLTASNNDIKVSIKGLALKGGRLGDYISVKNLTSNRIIEAKVIGKKEVLIKL